MPKHPPRLSGAALTAARVAAETSATHAIVREIFKKGLRIDALARLPSRLRADLPPDARPTQAREPHRRAGASLPPNETERAFPPSSAAFHRAFLDGRATPSAVAERALAAIAELRARRPSMNILAAECSALARAGAEAASARYAAGVPLGPLDGVPVLIKDEFDVAGTPTRFGSRAEPADPRPRDATVVERLRRRGAVILCKTVMTEYGMSPLGANKGGDMPHNPHNTSRAPGGSSTGSAVGVALGVAPIAAGADGGGSIRTPAAFCGVLGIKPTFGRVSRAGCGSGGSMSHAGPIGASAADLAAFLDAVASEPDPLDSMTAWAPPPPSGGFGAELGAGVRGLRIGVVEGELADASEPVAKATEEALRALEREGAALVHVKIPLARHAAAIGYVTIGPEALAVCRGAWLERRDRMNDDLRLSFAALSGVTSLEHLDAQRLRARLREETALALRDVDVLALPVTATTAPRYTEEDARASFSDPAALDGICRFAFLANLTGLPAGSAPVGVSLDGLPIGLQLIGDAWDEATVLGAMAHMERAGIAVVRRPQGAIDLL